MIEILDSMGSEPAEDMKYYPQCRSHTACRKRRIIRAKENRIKQHQKKIYSKRLLKIIELMNE